MSNQSGIINKTAYKLWRVPAILLSYLFHPVFVPVYFMLFLLYVHPIHFLGYTSRERLLILLQAVSMFSFFPLVTVGLLKALGFISSIQLREQKDRIIPLVASGIWYFWIWYVWKNMPGHAVVAIQYALGIWLSSIAALMLNTRFKISLHTLALGVTLCILLRPTFFRLTEVRKWKKGPTALLLMIVSLLVILFPVALLLQMLSGKLTYALEHSGELVTSLKQVVAEIEMRYHVVILSEANINRVGEWMASLLPRMLGATFNSLSTIFFLYFILYFLFTQGRAFEKALVQYLPFRADNVGLLEKEVHSMVVANAVGIPVVAFAQGIVGLIGYWLIGVKEPFFWFGITCIAGMLPVIGAALAYIPLIIIFLANGQMGQGIAMFFFGFGVIGTVDNFLRFTLLRKIGDVHPLVTVFGVIAGLSLFGFIGLIFGPLLISLLLLLIRIYRSEFVVKHGAIG